jgi:CheY-like chemotaxis protein
MDNGRTDNARTGTRILVVEDDFDLAEMLQELFHAAGYEMAVAHDGSAALSQAVSFLPNIILLDIHMPTLDGYALCKQLISQANRRFHIVAMTGDVRIDETHARAAGFDGLLHKPLDVQRALQLLAQLGAPSPRQWTFGLDRTSSLSNPLDCR